MISMNPINHANLLTIFVNGAHPYQVTKKQKNVTELLIMVFPFTFGILVGCRIPTKAAADFYEAAGTTAWPRTGLPWEQWDKIWKNYIDVCGEHTDFYSIHLYDWPSWHGPESTPGKGHIRTVCDARISSRADLSFDAEMITQLSSEPHKICSCRREDTWRHFLI